MKSTFLENILVKKRRRVDAAKSAPAAAEIQERARSVRSSCKPNALSTALKNTQRFNVIAEIKRASPSKGIINSEIDVAETARSYESGGACAISVLTEEDFFKGSLDDLRTARAVCSLPILRKDFIVDEFQIFEAAEAGADAILLIVAALSMDNIKHLFSVASDMDMDAVVEVHDFEDLAVVRGIGCTLIGVNNRSLHTFEVSLDVSRELITHKPHGALMIAESGISNREEINELHSLGFDAFLVGETLMRTGDPRAILEAWI
ncbi:MAG: indole-3-glycerol phosphate synthase TrpC [Acidobacteriota bacterium]